MRSGTSREHGGFARKDLIKKYYIHTSKAKPGGTSDVVNKMQY